MEFPLIQFVSFHLERFVMNKLLMALASLAILLGMTGCAVPFANQTGNVQACYQDKNGFRVCGVGVGSTAPQGVYQQQQPQQVIIQQAPPVIFQHQAPIFRPPQCPSNSRWDGVGCRVFQFGGRDPFDGNQCRSGGRQINGSWVCMDRMSFEESIEKQEGVDYVEPLEIFQSAKAEDM